MRAIASVPYGLAMVLWGVPTATVLPLAVVHHIRQHRHPRWIPMWEWIGQTTFMPIFLVGCGCAALALPRVRPHEARRGAPA